MRDERELHVIEPIVTADKYEYGLNRLSVPGGWVYWLQPAGGTVVSTFVPLPLEVDLIQAESVRMNLNAEALNEMQDVMIDKIMDRLKAREAPLKETAPTSPDAPSAAVPPTTEVTDGAS
jgi:hypothetical protein